MQKRGFGGQQDASAEKKKYMFYNFGDLILAPETHKK